MLGWEQILKLSQRILIEVAYSEHIDRAQKCVVYHSLVDGGLTQLVWECGLKGGSCMEGWLWKVSRKQFTKEHWVIFLEGKFLFASFCHIIKNSYQLKWRNLLAADQWRLKWIFFFFLCWHNNISIDHFLKWVIFGLGFLTSWWISRKNTNLCWCDFPFVF